MSKPWPLALPCMCETLQARGVLSPMHLVRGLGTPSVLRSCAGWGLAPGVDMPSMPTLPHTTFPYTTLSRTIPSTPPISLYTALPSTSPTILSSHSTR